jgi:pyruvate kinase
MNFGVFPFEQAILENEQVKHDEILTAMHFLQHNNFVKANEKVIVLHGDMWAVEGGTSTLKVITI